MNDQKLTLDLSDLTVESIAVVPADSLDSAAYGHGMRELAHSFAQEGEMDSRTWAATRARSQAVRIAVVMGTPLVSMISSPASRSRWMVSPVAPRGAHGQWRPAARGRRRSWLLVRNRL